MRQKKMTVKGHLAPVNLLEAIRASQDLHVTSILSFLICKQKSETQSLNPSHLKMGV